MSDCCTRSITTWQQQLGFVVGCHSSVIKSSTTSGGRRIIVCYLVVPSGDQDSTLTADFCLFTEVLTQKVHMHEEGLHIIENDGGIRLTYELMGKKRTNNRTMLECRIKPLTNHIMTAK